MTEKDPDISRGAEAEAPLGEAFQYIKLDGTDFEDFKYQDLTHIQHVYPWGLRIPDPLVPAYFSTTSACCEGITENLQPYEWYYVEVLFWDDFRMVGYLSISITIDTNDIVPGYKAYLSGGGRITYFDLLEGIRIRRIPAPDVGGLRDSTAGKVTDIL